MFYEYFYEKTFDAIGPIHIKYEYSSSEKFGLGCSIAYHRYKDINDLPILGYRLVARMNYHIYTGKKWDAYSDAGIGVGKCKAQYRLNASSPQILTDREIVPEIELGVGARYYFTKNIGLYIEAGIGKTIFHGGIAIELLPDNRRLK